MTRRTLLAFFGALAGLGFVKALLPLTALEPSIHARNHEANRLMGPPDEAPGLTATTLGELIENVYDAKTVGMLKNLSTPLSEIIGDPREFAVGAHGLFFDVK